MEVDKTAPDVAVAEVAKPLTPAEARRLRILAKAQERMAAVTGVNWKEPVDAARESSAVAAVGVPTEHPFEQSVPDDGPIAAAPAQLRQRHAESSRPAADRASRWAKQYAGATKASPGSARDPPQALTAGQALRCSAALTALPAHSWRSTGPTRPLAPLPAPGPGGLWRWPAWAWCTSCPPCYGRCRLASCAQWQDQR